jgi:preprotein translocase subunit SecG
MINILLVVHIVIAVLLIIVILMQKSGSDGLGGLGGGGGGGGLVTARAAANFLTRTTIVLATLFMINAIVLANLSGKKDSGIANTIEKELEADAIPMAK